jgi:hypothetical protein
VSTAVARMTRRAAWPTLTMTVLALLAVLGVLLLTGSRGGAAAGFGLSADPSVISLTAGDSAEVQLTVSTARDTTVTLATTALPPGVRLDLDLRSVRVSAGQPVNVAGRLVTSSSAATDVVSIGVTGRAGTATETSLIQLHIQPTGITDLAFPPPSRVTENASFTVSGSPRGMLAPGSSLPIDLRLVNANPFPLHIDSVTVAIAGTNKPACQLGNFSIVQYRGGYPLQLPAGSANTLSSLHVPARGWPQLRLLNTAQSWADCRDVTVRLRYAGSGSGG